MQVLWITNIIFPDLCEALKLRTLPSGWWMVSSANSLLANSEVKLSIATIYFGEYFLHKYINGISYYLLPVKDRDKYSKDLERYWKEIKDKENPDIVHIHGTEFPHGLAYLNACGSNNVVVSIQGLLGPCGQHYFDGMSLFDIMTSFTLRDLKSGSMLKSARILKKKGKKYEQIVLNRITHVIGRTEWDKAMVWSINPNAIYHKCNETLRNSFYHNIWEYTQCKKYSIYISQADYPLKGLHQLLKALPLVLKKYSDTKVYVAGNDPTRSKDGFWGRAKVNGYGNYLNKLIKKNKLKGVVTFLGFLNEFDVVRELKSANVFLLLSSIENSPNSLAEAQMVGVPCIASFVGGVSSMIISSDCGQLYRFEEYEVLAYKICELFENSSTFDNTYERKIANERHDVITNCEQLFSIYKSIVHGNR